MPEAQTDRWKPRMDSLQVNSFWTITFHLCRNRNLSLNHCKKLENKNDRIAIFWKKEKKLFLYASCFNHPFVTNSPADDSPYLGINKVMTGKVTDYVFVLLHHVPARWRMEVSKHQCLEIEKNLYIFGCFFCCCCCCWDLYEQYICTFCIDGGWWTCVCLEGWIDRLVADDLVLQSSRLSE